MDNGFYYIVDRDDVGASDVGQRDGGQAGEPGQGGQRAEEVVRAVDLVHLAGPGVADHHCGPVDPVPQARGVADQLFGLELRLVIGRRKFLGDIEIGFGVGPGERAGDRDGGDVVQGGVQLLGQGDHRAGALDIGGALLRLTHGQVVDRGGVHDMFDAGEFGESSVVQTELRCGQITDQGQGPVAPLGAQSFESAHRFTPHQYPHHRVGIAPQQCGDEPPPDEPGTAGNEIVHRVIVDPVPADVNKS